jgi:membrane protease YdiL (CAAX protease family)
VPHRCVGTWSRCSPFRSARRLSHAIYGPGALAYPQVAGPRALAEVAAVFLLQLVLFRLGEEIGFTGFLQHHWQGCYHPMKLSTL